MNKWKVEYEESPTMTIIIFYNNFENFFDSRVIKVGSAVSNCETCLVSGPNFKQASNNREERAYNSVHVMSFLTEIK